MHCRKFSLRSFLRAGVFSFSFLMLCTACVNDQELEYTPLLDVEPSCSDGLKNGDETTVDCGGACSDFCGEDIVAACSEDLTPNLLFSENDGETLETDFVYYGRSYSAENNLYIYLEVSEESGDREINIGIPIKKFPSGNMQFDLADEVKVSEENPEAVIEIKHDYRDGRISITGTLYLRMEGKNRVHLEFCDVLVKNTNNYYGQAYYYYSGNINFEVTDGSFLH